ncbi:MAG: NUDIX hydrolase, partial [Candidatus Sericytochromatia bacterium]|nr:NUDIX hydrolase [Candidatus Sericytochromatia bacterium]
IEESGLSSIKLFDDTIFDLVVHFVPSNKNEKSHYHYNVTYIFTADSNEKLIISDESNDLKWFTIDEFRSLIKEDSMIRMLNKSFK